MTTALHTWTVGDRFDLRLGPDRGHRYQWAPVNIVRVEVVDQFVSHDERLRVTVRAVGGGPTNVPRCEAWTPITYDAWEWTSMLAGGTLTKVDADGR